MKNLDEETFDPERWEFVISHIDRTLREIEEDWQITLENGPDAVFDAYGRRADQCLEKSLFFWRVKKDPRPSLNMALDFARKGLEFAAANDVENAVERSEFDLIWISQAATLVEVDFRLPPYTMRYKESGKEDWLKLNPYIYKRLKNIPTEDRVEALTIRSTERKVQPYIQNYLTYEALLDHNDPSHESFDQLVKVAETNYNRRAKDHFFRSNAIQGGDFYNAYVRDLTLAAILKKKGWTGESDHLWLW